MLSVFEYLCLRKPKLDYISPPICCDFSGSGGPVIVLDPFGRILAPTGLILGGDGGLTLTWDAYPGALCFNIYQAVDENNPDGEYVIIAECVEGNSFQLPPDGPPFFRVSAITPEGESELSTFVQRTGGGGGCSEFIDELPGTSFVEDLESNGIGVGGFGLSVRPYLYKNRLWADLRTIVSGGAVLASQSGNTILASSDFFSPADVGKFVRFSTNEIGKITVFGSPQSVTATPSQVVAQTTFELLGQTLGGVNGIANACNSSGIVAGEENVPTGGNEHVFWFNSTTGEIRDISPIPGDSVSVIDVSPNGFVLVDTIQGGTAHVCHIYDSVTNTFQALGLPAVGVQCVGGGLTSALIAGVHVDYSAGPNKVNRWQGGVFVDIHPAAAGTNSSSFVAMNSLGHIIGFYFDPVTFFESTFVNFGGASITLTAFGSDCDGLDINDAGTIVGTARSGGTFIPFFWTSGGGAVAIAGVAGAARAINNSEIIVGEIGSTAFLYKDGTLHNLIDLLPDGHGWTSLNTATMITDDNYIAGSGIINGNSREFICHLCF